MPHTIHPGYPGWIFYTLIISPGAPKTPDGGPGQDSENIYDVNHRHCREDGGDHVPHPHFGHVQHIQTDGKQDDAAGRRHLEYHLIEYILRDESGNL